MTDTTGMQVGGWVLIFSMRDGRDSAVIHTPAEILAVSRAWSYMRRNRNEPYPESMNGVMSAVGGNDVFVLHGTTLHGRDKTKAMLEELGACFGIAFSLEILEIYIGDKMYPLARREKQAS